MLPDRKVLAGGCAGVLVWLVAAIAARYGYPIPPEVQTAAVGGIGWLVAYVVPPSTRDIIKRLDNDLVRMAAADPSIPVTLPPPGKVATTVTQAAGTGGGITGTLYSVAPLALLALIALGLGGCQRAQEPRPLTAIVADAQSMTPEQRWGIACAAAEAGWTAYGVFWAPRASEATNARVGAAYAGVARVCANRPENYASALITLVQAAGDFNRALAAAKHPTA